jgi:hypothetical protein
MRTSALGRYALLFAVIATFAGCGGSPSASPTSALGSRTGTSDASQGDLLYVGGDTKSYVFSFKAGIFLGTIDSSSFGMCSDSGGNVFLTRVGSIAEYPHGATTPTLTYPVPGTAYSCAVDRTTGDLASVVLCFSGCTDEIAIFPPNGIGPPRMYQNPGMTALLYCGYDDAGNLFVDGYRSGGHFALAELPQGSDTFTNISIDLDMDAPGQVQWDGRYLAVEARFDPMLYRIRLSGSTGSVVGTTQFSKIGQRAAQSWIIGHTVVVPFGPLTKRPKEIRYWKYPAGGVPTKTIKGFIARLMMIDGVTVSVAPSGTRNR